MFDHHLPRLSPKRRQKLWKIARAMMRQAGHTKWKLNKTQFWVFRVITEDGRYTEVGNAGFPDIQPPIDRRRIRRYRRPKVLFIGKPLHQVNMTDADLTEIAAKHGLKNPRIVRSTSWNVWMAFFSRRHMLDAKTLDVPQLIVSTGTVRDYQAFGEWKSNFDSSERDRAIAEHWGIPIEFVTGSEEKNRLVS